jgi:hypothetical protein
LFKVEQRLSATIRSSSTTITRGAFIVSSPKRAIAHVRKRAQRDDAEILAIQS